MNAELDDKERSTAKDRLANATAEGKPLDIRADPKSMLESATAELTGARQEITKFFANSDLLDFMVLRPFSHINTSWELTWNSEANEYEREEGTFAPLLNDLITELSTSVPPTKYHDNEDCLAECVKESRNWNIYKEGKRWFGDDYVSILEQGGFKDINEGNFVQAARGRIEAALGNGQHHT